MPSPTRGSHASRRNAYSTEPDRVPRDSLGGKKKPEDRRRTLPMDGQAVVVGVGESEYYKHGKAPDTEFQLACTAIRRAADDAGLELSQLDGLVSYMDHRNSPLRIAAGLGFEELRWSATPWAGGGNNSSASIQFADAAVCGGYANYVVAFRALAQGQFYRLGSGSSIAAGQAPEGLAWSAPYGLM